MSFSTCFKSAVGAAILSFAIFFFSMAGTAPAAYAAGPITVGGKALVTNTDGDAIRVRDGAGTKYDVVATSHEGETASVLAGPSKDSDGNSWYKVQVPGGTGWILVDFLASKSAPGPAGSKSPSQAASPKTSSVTMSGKSVVTNTGGDAIMVRDGAGTKYDVRATAHQGETASILAGPSKDANGNDWYKVQVPGGTGWVLSDFLESKAGSGSSASKSSPSKPANTMATGGKAVVTNTDGDPIRVRDGAGTKYDVVAEAHEGESASVLAGPSKDGDGNSWYKVQVPGGAGWILVDFLSVKAGSNSSAAKPAQQAASPKTAGLTAGGKALVTNTDGDNIRVRDGASTKHSQVAEAHEGETASVLAGPSKDDKGNVWYKVQVPDGTGWMLSGFLAGKAGSASAGPSSQASKSQAAKPSSPTSKLSGFARVANTEGDYLRIRSNPSRKGSVLTTISPDTTLAVKKGPVVDSEKITWYQVTNGGVTGWAMGQYMSQAPAPAKAAAKVQPKASAPAPAKPAGDSRAVVARGAQPSTDVKSSNLGFTIVGTAMKYLGSRYVFGGASPRGFDCSGFISYVVNRSGKGIARDMYSQINSGARVSSNSLQPGDLLFFSNTYKRGLSHAGIYIGNGKFIHAENESTGVTISAVWSAYWASHYTAAVRVR